MKKTESLVSGPETEQISCHAEPMSFQADGSIISSRYYSIYCGTDNADMSNSQTMAGCIWRDTETKSACNEWLVFHSFEKLACGVSSVCQPWISVYNVSNQID